MTTDHLTMLCDMHDLTILGSWFKRLDIHRMTWISHDGTTRKEIDHVITRHREKGLFHSCRVYRGAEAPANSDHVLLVAELCIPILKRKRHQAAAVPFDVARLSNDPVLQTRYSVSIQNKFDALDHLPDDVDTASNTFSSIVKDTAKNLVGTKTRTNKPWLSRETTAILEQKSAAKVRGTRWRESDSNQFSGRRLRRSE